MNRLLVSALALSFSLSAAAQEKTTSTVVELTRVYADSLVQHETHTYASDLQEGYFVRGSVNQITVDVVVRVLNPVGENVGEFDGPGRGGEDFQFTTGSAGRYRFEVTPFEDQAGRYEFTLLQVEPEATTPEGKVDQLMAAYSGMDTPGGVVAIARNGQLDFARAYGMADLTFGIPMTVETRNNIGSTSKQFTAFAVLLLAERGDLSLDDDVRDYIEELPDFGQRVTIRHLLTHTSGYREFLNTVAMAGRRLDEGDYIDREELIRIVERQPQLQNAPGAEWNYNNTAFGLATVIVERITGETFPEWMRENVFEPVGMLDTYVRPHRQFVIPQSSRGYGRDRLGGYRELSDLSAAMGAGGIYTTAGDLAKWMDNLLTGKYGGRRLVEQMTTRYVLADGDTTAYGLGVFVDEFRGLERIHHGGADNAHRSHFALYPETGLGVIVHSNFASFTGTISGDVTEAFLSDYLAPEEVAEQEDESRPFDPVSYDPESFDAYAGRYELEEAPGFILSFSRRGDSLFTQASGQPEVPIYPTSDSTFALQAVEASVTFHRSADGGVTSLTLHQNGDHAARRLETEPWAPDVDALGAFTGDYFSEELETHYTIVIEDSALVMRHRRLDDISLSPSDEDAFSARFPIATVAFVRSGEGSVTGFNASNGRTRDVWFAKQN